MWTHRGRKSQGTTSSSLCLEGRVWKAGRHDGGGWLAAEWTGLGNRMARVRERVTVANFSVFLVFSAEGGSYRKPRW